MFALYLWSKVNLLGKRPIPSFIINKVNSKLTIITHPTIANPKLKPILLIITDISRIGSLRRGALTAFEINIKSIDIIIIV